MERTISRIKNLKARRKLSLPASPNPTRIVPSNAGSHQENGGNAALPYSRIRSISPDEYERQNGQGGSGTAVAATRTGSAGGANKGGVAQRTVSERYRKVQWSPDVRGRMGELEAIRQTLRNGEVSGRADATGNNGSISSGRRVDGVAGASSTGRRASASVRHLPPESPSVGNGSGRYRRSDSVSTMEEESLRKGRNHSRHGSLPHVFRSLYLHPGKAIKQ